MPKAKNINTNMKKEKRVKGEDWHAMSVTKVLENLKTSLKGLSIQEAKSRLAKYRENVLPRKKAIPRLVILLDQFKSPLIYILLIAALISLFFHKYIDTGVILGAVFLNTIIGFFQENKANKSLEKLRTFIEPTVLVVRDRQNIEVTSKELVPGDIIYLQTGNYVPADCRIIKATDLEINEASLTGESMASTKQAEPIKVGVSLIDRESMAYMGTFVVRGNGQAIVTATGEKTEMGKIAQLVSSTKEEKTPLQLRLARFGRQLGLLITIICLFIVITGVWQKRDILDMFITGVALAVSAIPEGLPIAVTVILTIGMQRILAKKSLVRKLIAAETLGSTTVICTDKTGTLTEGKMQVSSIVFPDQKVDLVRGEFKHKNPELIHNALRICLHCNDAIMEETGDLAKRKITGLPTDQALLAAPIQAGLIYQQEKKDFPQISEVPFDSEKKYMLTMHQVKNKTSMLKTEAIIFAKGAPEVILDKSNFVVTSSGIKKIAKKDKENIIFELKKLSSQGLRIISLAYRDVKKNEEIKDLEEAGQNLVFVGLVTLKDPLRKETAQTIAICCQAGIRPIIITGDYKLTAKAIAQEVGIKLKPENIMEGSALDKIDDKKLVKEVKNINLYTRVSPHHKLRIVSALRKSNEVVAMIGDGINDAPAIKSADIGVALGSGTDVAKETSDIVLLDNNFSVIVEAIKQGRIIFSNIRKVITYLISDSFSEVILIVGSIFLGLPLAILPAQILWINIVNDGLPDFSLAFEKGDSNIMNDKPIKKDEPILNKEMKAIIFGVGIIRDSLILALFLWLFYQGTEIQYLRTIIFAILGFKSLLSIFSLRSFRRPIWRLNPLTNLYLIGAVLISLSLLLVAIYWPPLQAVLETTSLDISVWLLIVSVGIISVFMIEFIKYWYLPKQGKMYG